MKQKRFSDEQIIGILKEVDAGAVVLDLCRKHGMSSATFYTWKPKYCGLEVSEARKLRGLEEKNAKLKRLLAEAMLDNTGLKDLKLKLPRFDGHPTRFRERCCHAENPSPLFTGVPPPDRRSGALWP